MGGVRKVLETVFFAALSTALALPVAIADEMSSSEIFRRMELQLGENKTGGATRGLRLSYGDEAIGEGERQAEPVAPQRIPAERRAEVQLVS